MRMVLFLLGKTALYLTGPPGYRAAWPILRAFHGRGKTAL
jgi:hypothetical protein